MRFSLLSFVPFTFVTLQSSSSSPSVICQTTGPKPLPKWFLHIVRSRASSFNWQYPLLSLRSSSSFLRLLPLFLVTSICPFIFPSITCCRGQFLRNYHLRLLSMKYFETSEIFTVTLQCRVHSKYMWQETAWTRMIDFQFLRTEITSYLQKQKFSIFCINKWSFTLKMKALRTFETPRTIYPTRQFNIPAGRICQNSLLTPRIAPVL